MFETVAMSRLTVAAPVANMEQVLRACTNEGCVHVETYTNFEEGVHVGQAVASEEANHVSALLAKVRAAVSAFKPVNVDGPMPVAQVKNLIDGSFPEELQEGLDLLDAQRLEVGRLLDDQRLEAARELVEEVAPDRLETEDRCDHERRPRVLEALGTGRLDARACRHWH